MLVKEKLAIKSCFLYFMQLCIFVYLFIYGLFNNAVSNSGLFVDCLKVLSAIQTMSSDWLINECNELERIWKEAVIALHKVLSQDFSGGTEENLEKLYDSLGART
jgi:hypothetical protein